MASKYKTTPFFRFLLAMLVIVPLAYFGASYYRGQDPFTQTAIEAPSRSSELSASQLDLIKEQNKLIKQLEAQIKKKDKEISRLKNQ